MLRGTVEAWDLFPRYEREKNEMHQLEVIANAVEWLVPILIW